MCLYSRKWERGKGKRACPPTDGASFEVFGHISVSVGGYVCLFKSGPIATPGIKCPVRKKGVGTE